MVRRDYQIKLVSQTNSVVWLVVCAILFFLSGILFPGGLKKENAVLATIITITAAYFLWRKYVVVRTSWIVSEERICIVWKRKLAFFNIQKLEIPWNNIEDIKFGFDLMYFHVKIKLKSKEVFVFYLANTNQAGLFSEFIMQLRGAFETKRSN